MPLRFTEKIRDAQRLKFAVRHAGDEFAADSVPRVARRLDQPHRHVTAPQRDAQRESRESSSCDGYWVHSGWLGPHGFHVIRTDEGAGHKASPVPQSQRARKLVFDKPGANAGEHVVIGYIIETSQRGEQVALCQMKPFPRRLAGQHDSRHWAELASQRRQVVRIEVMQEQICDHNLRRRQLIHFENALSQPAYVGMQFIRPWCQIDGSDLFCSTDARTDQCAAQPAITRTELQNTPARFDQRFQPAQDPPVIAHDAIDQPQFFAAADRGGIIGWEMIEDFAFDKAVHGCGTKPREAARAPYLYFASTSPAFAGSTFS